PCGPPTPRKGPASGRCTLRAVPAGLRPAVGNARRIRAIANRPLKLDVARHDQPTARVRIGGLPGSLRRSGACERSAVLARSRIYPVQRTQLDTADASGARGATS